MKQYKKFRAMTQVCYSNDQMTMILYALRLLGLNVQKLEEGSPVTRDLRINRVRVFYDESGNVSSEPRTGWRLDVHNLF